MRAIIIGAGRGQRLRPLTDDSHKSFTEIQGKRILDWILEAFAGAGIDDVCFIEGFNGDVVREAYPQFTFRRNGDWANNNILVSLMHAEDLMDQSFITTYCDILYTPRLIRDLVAATADIALGTDTDWVSHYRYRSQHPPSDAEKLTVKDGLVTRVSRTIDAADAYGEFVGVAKFSTDGARLLREHYHRCRERFSGREFREGRVFEDAMMIHLFDEMIENGVAISHVDTHGHYREIDTHQDLELANRFWRPPQ